MIVIFALLLSPSFLSSMHSRYTLRPEAKSILSQRPTRLSMDWKKSTPCEEYCWYCERVCVGCCLVGCSAFNRIISNCDQIQTCKVGGLFLVGAGIGLAVRAVMPDNGCE